MQSYLRRRQQQLIISPGLFIIVIFFAAGICWAETLIPYAQVEPYAALLLLSILFIFHKFNFIQTHKALSYTILGFLFFFLGLLYGTSRHVNLPADPHHIFNRINEKQIASVEGVLQQYPSVINSPTGPQTRLLVEVKTILQPAEPVTHLQKFTCVSGLVLLNLNGPLPEGLKPGDRFLAKTSISRVSTYSTPGAFDYKKYLANKSIFIRGSIQSPFNIFKLHSDEHVQRTSDFASLRYLPERFRNHIADFLNKTLTQPERGLYKAILIGDRTDVPPSVINNFTSAGCLHILAISGMHMGLLALVTIAGLYWILKRSTWLLLHTPVLKIAVTLALLPLLLYALIAGLNIPVVRALLMTTIVILAILFDRPGNLINHILLAAFLILVWKPGTIFSASFQLSFAAVISIALIYPSLYRYLCKKIHPEAHLFTPEQQTETFLLSQLMVKSHDIFFKWFLAGIAITSAAMLGTLPLLLFHFNRFSVTAPVSNLLVEPLICFWSLIIGLFASLCSPLFPALATNLFTAGSLGLVAAEKICASFSLIPFGSLWFPTPSLMEIIIYYSCLLSSVIVFHLAGRQKRNAFIIALFLFCSLLAAPIITSIARQSSGRASVSFLDVGHGASILLQLPQNNNILIDGGGAGGDNFDIGERVIGPFLWKQKIRRLDAVVVTHPHSDHFNGLPFILTRFRPRTLWINGSNRDEIEYKELLELAEKLGIETITAKTDEILYQSGSTRIECLHGGEGFNSGYAFHSGHDKSFNPNDLSLVLRLDTNNKSFLFPADISSVMAEKLVQEQKKLKADVLMAPHHGSASSLSRSFISNVAPDYIAISAGRNNPFNFPAKSFQDLEQKGIEVLSTGSDGTITFYVEGGKLSVNSYQIN